MIKVNGINVINEEIAEQADIEQAVDHAIRKYGRDNLRCIEMDIQDGYIGYTPVLVPFDRIRRVTGYLVGTLDRWNNGKRAEERDRVKHGVE